MKPDAFDTLWARRCRVREWVACAAMLFLFSLFTAPEIVYAGERTAAKAEKNDVRRGLIESDLKPSREITREGSRPPTSLSRWRDASPRERRAIRKKARERWENANPRERRSFRRGMAGLGRVLPELTEIERLMLLRNLFALPKDERKLIRARFGDIDRLGPGERKAFMRELRDMTASPSQESIRLERNVDRWRELSKLERDAYRGQMHRFRSLSAEDRRRLLDEWERSPEAQP